MKPKEYVKKYNLDSDVEFNHSEFTVDLTFDFLTLLEYHRQHDTGYAKFKLCVKDIRQKFDSINNRSGGKIPEKVWKYFFATVVVKYRDSLYEDFLAKQKEEYEERKREQEEYRRWERGDDIFGEIFRELYLRMVAVPVPHDSFSFLQLGSDSSVDQIKTKYKTLAFQYHPDQGGDEAKFKTLVEAKNRCLAFVGSMQ